MWSGYTLSAAFLAFAFRLVPAVVGFGKAPGYGLILGAIFDDGSGLGRSAKETELSLRRFSWYLFCGILPSSWLNNCRVFGTIGLNLQELFAPDTEVFFEKGGVAKVCLEHRNADVAYDGGETDNGRYGLVADHPVVQPRWDVGLFSFSNDQVITQGGVHRVARTRDDSHEKGPSDPETAKIDTGVEVMGAPFDGFEDARVPL